MEGVRLAESKCACFPLRAVRRLGRRAGATSTLTRCGTVGAGARARIGACRGSDAQIESQTKSTGAALTTAPDRTPTTHSLLLCTRARTIARRKGTFDDVRRCGEIPTSRPHASAHLTDLGRLEAREGGETGPELERTFASPAPLAIVWTGGDENQRHVQRGQPVPPPQPTMPRPCHGAPPNPLCR